MYYTFENPIKDDFKIATEEEFNNPSEEKVQGIIKENLPGPKEMELLDDGIRRSKLQKGLEDNFISIETDRLYSLDPQELKEMEKLVGNLPNLMQSSMNGKTINMDAYNKAYNRIQEIIKGGK